MNTRFNVYFNGITSYDEGMKNIKNTNVEDFSEIIPMYPISKELNAKAATSSMDKTIEKSRKAIKLYSIKQKPKPNSKKANNPEYKLFYNQKEFNPALKDAWLLLAKAEFHKGDFLGSVGTFAYIARYYSTDKDMVTKCQLWTARAYKEMGWIYEAEQVLSKINQNDIKSSDTGFYSSVNADLLIKKGQHKDAIPFLEITLSKEKDKYLKQRFSYILAQLHQKTGNNKAAYYAYQKVLKLNPPYDMDFNARINSIELYSGKANNNRKDIKKMIRNQNNKDYLDQLYYVLGKTYLQTFDTLKALENFKLSVEKSTRNGVDKALTLITMGDLYYNKKEYIKAHPCYDDASKIITNIHPEFSRVTTRAQSLGELVVQFDIVTLQDSLQRLSAMPESKRLEIVNKIIEKIIADEKAEAEKKEEAQTEENFNDIESGFMPPVSNLRVGNTAGEWYFYNVNLMKTGQKDFQKKWGKRKLEDNWRRMNKSAVLFAEETEAIKPNSIATTNDSTATKDSTILNDSTDITSTKLSDSDNKNPEFYLQQIPVTALQIAKSNEEIATAMYKMGFIYKEKVEDLQISIRTFEEFQRRFPTDERIPDTYFQNFLMHAKLGNATLAENFRTKLLSNYPESKYAKLLSSPNYIAQQNEMLLVQDSVYNVTYKAYNQSDFNTVKKNATDFLKKYPQSGLAPKFLFLNALSIGKTDNSDVFEKELSKLVENYPESDVSAMSKDILALMMQGKESKTGTSHGTLLTKRNDEIKTDETVLANLNFTSEKITKHRLLLITSADNQFINKLLYNVASFNFSRFMVKDFDLVVTKLDSLRKVLSVTNFETYDETDWYLNSLSNDTALTNLINKSDIQKVIISENNFGLINTLFKLEDYLSYQSANLITKPDIALAQNTVQIPTQIPTQNKVQIPAQSQNRKKETAKKQEPIQITEPKITEPKTTAGLTASSKVTDSIPKKASVEKLDKKYAEQIQSAVSETSTVQIPVKPGLNNQQNTLANQPTIQKLQKEAPLFKNLFLFRPNEPHFVSIAIMSGNMDFEKTKTAIDAYNNNNYGIMNLKVSLETSGKMQTIIIGSFTDANIAKSYLIRMVKERKLFENMKDASYRNLVGTQANLNVMMQQNAIKTYIEFMQEYYLK